MASQRVSLKEMDDNHNNSGKSCFAHCRSLCSSFAAVLMHIKDHATERISDFFAWWAAKVFDHPYKFILGTLIFVLLMCVGFIPGIPVWIDGAEALYSLPYSTARSQGAVHKVLFNETTARPSFVLVTGSSGENIFTWEHLEAVHQLDLLIRGKSVDPIHGRRLAIKRKPEYHTSSENENIVPRSPSTVVPKKQQRDPTMNFDAGLNETIGTTVLNSEDGASTFAKDMISLINNATVHRRRPEDDRGDAGLDVLTFQDICSRNSFGECAVSGIQEMGVYDMKSLLEVGSPPLLFLFDGLAFNAKKKAFPPHFLLGRANETKCTPDLPKSLLSLFYTEDKLIDSPLKGMARANMTCITRVEAFQLVYEIADRPIWTKRNEDWEKVFVEVLGSNGEFGPLKVTMSAFRSRDDALRASTSESSDVLFVAFTFVLLVAYSTSLNFSCDLYRSKSYPALSGVVAAVLGMVAGMGFMSLCGVSFVPTALVCPFLVVGVGVDDMFVIINCYSLSYMVDSARDRCVLSLRDTGLAITITTTTSLISFIIGLNTGYLSIKNFCWFCGAGMFFGYLFVLTFFFAFHCLDAKREEENVTCLCFVPTNARREARRVQLRSEGVTFSETADIKTCTLGALMVRRHEQDALRRHALRLHQRQQEQHRKRNEEEAKREGRLVRRDAKTEHGTSGLTYSDTQETVGTLSPDVSDTVDPMCLEHQDRRKSQGSKGKTTNARVWINGWICCRWMVLMFHWFHESLEAWSDRLLSRVALEGHRVAMSRDGLERTPWNGILAFEDGQDADGKSNRHLDKKLDPLVDILHRPEIPLYYYSTTTGEKKLFIMEPMGSVGLGWRKFFIRYYGPLLVHPISKLLVILFFLTFLAVGLYGCSQLKSGLDLKDLAPLGSYLNRYDQTHEQTFRDYDFPVDIFFPEFQAWWTFEMQNRLRELENRMRQTGSGKLVTNPLIRMLDDPELKRGLQSGKQELFEKTLYNALALENGKYKQFELNFIWEGTHLRAWKMQMLPAVMKTSAERAAWMSQIRRDCEAQLHHKHEPMVVMAYNYMMTFYESDLMINASVISNMVVAAITMLIVSLIGIPQLMAGFCVILIMALIDIGIIGFMYFWDVKLNMVSMICLLLSVGFAVDFSAHVCHTFMEAEGQTKNQRAIECLVLMGNPVFHGAASSILGVLMLGFSTSYIFRVFFKMMTMVTVFALAYSVVFLPVLLSIVGRSEPHHQAKRKDRPQKSQLPAPLPGQEKPQRPGTSLQSHEQQQQTDGAIDVSSRLSRCHQSSSSSNQTTHTHTNKLYLPNMRSRQTHPPHPHHFHRPHHLKSPHSSPYSHSNRHRHFYSHPHQLVRVIPKRSSTPSYRYANRRVSAASVQLQQQQEPHTTTVHSPLMNQPLMAGSSSRSRRLPPYSPYGSHGSRSSRHPSEVNIPSSHRRRTRRRTEQQQQPPQYPRLLLGGGAQELGQELGQTAPNRRPSVSASRQQESRGHRASSPQQQQSDASLSCRVKRDRVDPRAASHCAVWDRQRGQSSRVLNHCPPANRIQDVEKLHRVSEVEDNDHHHHAPEEDEQLFGYCLESNHGSESDDANEDGTRNHSWRYKRRFHYSHRQHQLASCYNHHLALMRRDGCMASGAKHQHSVHNSPQHAGLSNRGHSRGQPQQRDKRKKSESDGGQNQEEEWIDMDCRIDVPDVIPTEKIDWNVEGTIVVGASELKSPERHWKSPVVRRKQREKAPLDELEII